MKTHTHYTTPITLAPWVRRGTAALVAVSIGLFYALSPSLNHTASAPAASAARQRVASSRVFQDEVLGADQANLAFMTSNTSASANRQPSQAVRALAARKRIASSRVFQDEVLGADQLNMAALAAPSGAFPQPMDDLRRAGPR